MKSNISKILSIFIAVIAVIGAFLFIRIFLTDADDAESLSGSVGTIVSFSTILLYIAIGATVIGSIFALFTNPDGLKKTLLGVAVLAIVLVIAYFMSDTNAVLDTTGAILKGGEPGSSTNKWVGTGIWYSVALGLVASAFFVYDLLKGLIKS
jgi:hypothetical protein